MYINYYACVYTAVFPAAIVHSSKNPAIATLSYSHIYMSSLGMVHSYVNKNSNNLI